MGNGCETAHETRRGGFALLAGILALLAVIPYLRALSVPFISDDYLQIWLAREFGAPGGWKELAADALYRCRATSLLLTYWTDQWFGMNQLAYGWSSILIHVLNTWLVFALGVWRPIGWRISAVAAAFFAVYEGHQEAVIWYAALPELLVFAFTLAAFLMWMMWLQGGRWGYAAAALILAALAMFSKEPGVVLVPMMLLSAVHSGSPWRRWLAPWFAVALMAAGYTALVFAGSGNHLHFHDGTFSLKAPILLTIAWSMFRMFWIWGFLALGVLACYRAWRANGNVVLIGLVWATVTLIPYSFISYMPFVPSRHIYLASVGLSLVVAAAFTVLLERIHRPMRVAVALAVLIAGYNCAYIWTRKQRQFLERAAPTEQLIQFARSTRQPVLVHCFPYNFENADLAVRMVLGKRARHVEQLPVSTSEGEVFCYPPHAVASARGSLGSGQRMVN